MISLQQTTARFTFPHSRVVALWSETWQETETRLGTLEAVLRKSGAVISRGGDFDRWDLEIHGGILGGTRVAMAIEEHGGGKQLARFRIMLHYSRGGVALALVVVTLNVLALLDHAWLGSVGLGLIGSVIVLIVTRDCAATVALCRDVLQEVGMTSGDRVADVAAPSRDVILSGKTSLLASGGRGDPPRYPRVAGANGSSPDGRQRPHS